MIAGMTAIHSFPLDLQLVGDLVKRVRVLVLWFDLPWHGRKPEFERLISQCGQHLEAVIYLLSKSPWSPGTFREPQLRALDEIRPDYVLQPDSDETFGPGFETDLANFETSGRDLMLFGYDMPTEDGAWVPTQPKSPHCKVFRWRQGLAFTPYRGYAQPTGLHSVYHATSRMQHYCCWTPEIQRAMLHKSTLQPSQRDYWGQRRPRGAG